jgi:hypothetical protein
MHEKNKVHAAGNAHFDRDWQWPFDSEGALEAWGTTLEALKKMRVFEQFTFEGLSPFLYPYLAQVDPEMVAEIRMRTQEGRFGLSNITWVEPDGNLPNYESMYRQVMMGLEAQDKYLGRTGKALKVDDAFGMDRRWPDVLSSAGVKYVVFKRPGKEERPLPSETFEWIGQGGGKVLAHRVEEIGTWGKSLPRHLAQILNSDRKRQDPKLALYGVSDHGGGPTREQILSLLLIQHHGHLPEELCEQYGITAKDFLAMQNHWQMLGRLVEQPEILAETTFQFSTVEAFCESLGAVSVKRPEWSQELQYHAVGCYLAEPEIKHSNQAAERVLNSAERIRVMTEVLTGLPYPVENFKSAWEKVLINQFHDILPGSSIEEVYSQSEDRYGAARSEAADQRLIGAHRIIKEVEIPQYEGSFPIVAFNEHPWPVRQRRPLHVRDYDQSRHILVDANGQAVPFQDVFPDHHGGSRSTMIVDLPEFGYTTLQFIKATPEEKQALVAQWQREHQERITEPMSLATWQKRLVEGVVDPTLIKRHRQLWENLPLLDREMENKRLRVTVDPKTGGVFIYDKKFGYEVFKPGRAGGVPTAFVDTTSPNDKEPADTWGHWETTFQTKDPDLTFMPTSIKRLEDGPVVDTIQVDSTLYRRTTLSEAPAELIMSQVRQAGIPEAMWAPGKEIVMQDRCYRIEAVDWGMGSLRVVPFKTHWEPTASRITQRFSLAADENEVEVEVELECKEKHVMVKLVYPYHGAAYREGYFETPGGVQGQPLDGAEHPVQRFLGAQFETNEQTKEGLKFRRGLFVMSPQASSGAVNREEVQLSVTRTPIYSHHAPFKREVEKIGAYKHQGMRPLTFDYRIVPADASWQKAGIVRRAMAYTQPAGIYNTNGHPGRLPMECSSNAD